MSRDEPGFQTVIEGDADAFGVYRLAVPGGWIYVIYDKDVTSNAMSHSTVFVPYTDLFPGYDHPHPV